MASRHASQNVVVAILSDSIHPVPTHVHWLSRTIAADAALELDKAAGND